MSVAPELPRFLIETKTPAGLHIRLVTNDDCRPLYRACFAGQSFSRYKEQFYRLLDWQENGRCVWVVATNDNGKILANGQLLIYPHGAELANLAVVPHRQNEGIGTAIIEVLTAAARSLHLSALKIGVTLDNTRARHLYQRLGFAEERHIRLPNDEPAIILRKELENSAKRSTP